MSEPDLNHEDLGWDAIYYARQVLADPDHKDADEFSACARETLAGVLAGHDRLLSRHCVVDNGPRLVAAVRAALALRDKMQATYEDDRYRAVWECAQIHRGPYTGPTWIAEAAAFDAAASEAAE